MRILWQDVALYLAGSLGTIGVLYFLAQLGLPWLCAFLVGFGCGCAFLKRWPNGID